MNEEKTMPHTGKGYPKKPREQHTYDGDAMSDATATTPEGKSLTRQEFADDADVNKLLGKFGVDAALTSKQPIYGQSIDYGMDLQAAYDAVTQAQKAINAVPDELRDKYKDWTQVMRAAETGEYQRDLEELAKKKEKEAATPVAPAPQDTEKPPEATPKP